MVVVVVVVVGGAPGSLLLLLAYPPLLAILLLALCSKAKESAVFKSAPHTLCTRKVCEGGRVWLSAPSTPGTCSEQVLENKKLRRIDRGDARGRGRRQAPALPLVFLLLLHLLLGALFLAPSLLFLSAQLALVGGLQILGVLLRVEAAEHTGTKVSSRAQLVLNSPFLSAACA